MRRAASSRAAIASGGGRVLAPQEIADIGAGNVSLVQEIEKIVCYRIGRLSEGYQAIDRLGELRRTAWAMPHLAGDEARIDGTGANNAG